MNISIAIFGGADPRSSEHILLFVCACALCVMLARVLRRFARNKIVTRSLFGLMAVGLAVCGAALRQEYLVSRAEYFRTAMQMVPPGQRLVSSAYIGGRCIARSADGVASCPLGTEEEVTQYLELMNRQWFSRTVIALRESVLPTRASTTTNQSAPLRVTD